MNLGYTFRFLILITVCSLPLRAAHESIRTEEKTISSSPNALVAIHMNDGPVQVSGWDKDSIHISIRMIGYGRTQRQAEKAVNNLRVYIRQKIQSIDINEIYTGKNRFMIFDLLNPRYWHEGRAHRKETQLRLFVPENASLNLLNDTGQITIQSICGKIMVRQDKGNIQLLKCDMAGLEIYSGDGDVHLSHCIGRDESELHVEMDDGNFTVDTLNALSMNLMIHNGNANLDHIRLKQLDMELLYGDLSVNFADFPDGKYRLLTENGDLQLGLSDQPNLKVNIRTDDGRIESDFKIMIQRSNDAESMRGMLGGGQGFIKASTERGDIRILKKTATF